MPFLNKNGTRAPDQDAAEAKRNKNWDPNAPLWQNPARPVTLAPEAAPWQYTGAPRPPRWPRLRRAPQRQP